MGLMLKCYQHSRQGYCRNCIFSFKSNIKNYWSARYSCASNIRNYMSYANYAATNQIPVFSCIFIDVIIIFVVILSNQVGDRVLGVEGTIIGPVAAGFVTLRKMLQQGF